MRMGRATVTDLTLAAIEGQTLFRLALWNDAASQRIGAGLGTTLPGPCRATTIAGLRWLWLELGHWLCTCATADAEAQRERLETLVGSDGSLVEVGAALVGRRVTGSGWRALLMIGGVFDAEDPGFGPGSVARTTMHHCPLLIDVITEDCIHAYVPTSYAAEFFAFWDADAAQDLG